MDVLFLLAVSASGEKLDKPTAKEANIIASLTRKMFVDKDFKITEEGKKILAFLDTVESLQMTKKIVKDEIFDRWWNAYPATDQWEHNGKVFTGERGLRVKKDECRTKFHEILNEGEYTVDQLIAAVEYEVTMKKTKSLETGENRMGFMQLTTTYVNQRTFENFVELAKKGVPQLSTTTTKRDSSVNI